jgi:outer membrane protein
MARTLALKLRLFLLLILCPMVARGDRPSASTQPSSGSSPDRVTLQEALRRALARNPSLAGAKAEIDRAEALVRQARAASLPSLSGLLTYTRLDGERALGDRVVAGANSLNANVSLSLPLLHTQRWTQWSHARDNLQSTRANSDDMRRQIAVATARAFLAVLTQHRVLDVNERACATARAHWDFARRRFEGGAGTKLEVVRAEQELAGNDVQLQTALGAMARTREALGVLLGEEGPMDSQADPGLPQPANLDEALHDLKVRRSDLKALELRLRAAQNQVRDGWTDFMPYLTGVFQPFYQDPPSLTQPRTGWQAQLILTIPFYDGGLRYGQQRERRALFTAAQANVEAALRQARAEVRSTVAVMRQADKALFVAQKAAQLAAEALRLVNRAYQSGATTQLEIIDAARRSRDAETAAVVAEDAARQARLDLLLACGRFP